MVIIEFILALLFVCLMISLFVSWMIEFWSSQINKKGKLLHHMLGKLIDLNGKENWIGKLYEHPMIKSLSSQKKGLFFKKKTRLTSYIPPNIFSNALTNLIINEGQKQNPNIEEDGTDLIGKIKLGYKEIPEGDFKKTIQTILNKSEIESSNFHIEIEEWYNEYMQRVNHAYKRFVKFPLWIVGFVFALIFNIDSVRITTELWNDGPLRNNIANMAEQFVDTTKTVDSVSVTKQFFQELKKEMSLPIGWKYYKEDFNSTEQTIKSLFYTEKNRSSDDGKTSIWIAFVLLKLIGFSLTGLIASFGAPFWYDALQKIIGLKKGLEKS